METSKLMVMLGSSSLDNCFEKSLESQQTLQKFCMLARVKLGFITFVKTIVDQGKT